MSRPFQLGRSLLLEMIRKSQKRAKIEASLAVITAREEGFPDLRWLGRDSSVAARKSRANRWGLADPSFWALIAAWDCLFSGLHPVRYRGGMAQT